MTPASSFLHFGKGGGDSGGGGGRGVQGGSLGGIGVYVYVRDEGWIEGGRGRGWMAGWLLDLVFCNVCVLSRGAQPNHEEGGCGKAVPYWSNEGHGPQVSVAVAHALRSFPDPAFSPPLILSTPSSSASRGSVYIRY